MREKDLNHQKLKESPGDDERSEFAEIKKNNKPTMSDSEAMSDSDGEEYCYESDEDVNGFEQPNDMEAKIVRRCVSRSRPSGSAVVSSCSAPQREPPAPSHRLFLPLCALRLSRLPHFASLRTAVRACWRQTRSTRSG